MIIGSLPGPPVQISTPLHLLHAAVRSSNQTKIEGTIEHSVRELFLLWRQWLIAFADPAPQTSLRTTLSLVYLRLLLSVAAHAGKTSIRVVDLINVNPTAPYDLHSNSHTNYDKYTNESIHLPTSGYIPGVTLENKLQSHTGQSSLQPNPALVTELAEIASQLSFDDKPCVLLRAAEGDPSWHYGLLFLGNEYRPRLLMFFNTGTE